MEIYKNMIRTLKEQTKKLFWVITTFLIASPALASESLWGNEKLRESLMNFAADSIVVASPLILGILTVLLTRLMQYLSTKTKNEKVKGAFEKVDDLLMNAVSYTSATYTQKLIDARQPDSPGGVNLTKEEQEEAMRITLEAFKTHAGTKGLKDIYSVLGLTPEQADDALKIRAEAILNEQNIQKKALFARHNAEND